MDFSRRATQINLITLLVLAPREKAVSLDLEYQVHPHSRSGTEVLHSLLEDCGETLGCMTMKRELFL